MRRVWRKFFAIDEIESSPLLQTLYWILLFGFFLSFSEWIGNRSTTLQAVAHQRHVCLPYFQNCSFLYVFGGWPDSYDQSLIYAGLSSLLALSALAAYFKDWEWAHALMFPALFWKLFILTVFTYQSHMDVEYFHIPEVLAFLLLRRKEFFLRHILVATYFLAATMKFSEGWIVGSYFSSLKAGMPLVPKAWIPWVTNSVALFEILTPWMLLSRTRWLRLSAVAMWSLFHLYSIVLVEFRYPAYCLPLLWLLFLPEPPALSTAPWRDYRRGAGFLLVFFLLASVPHNQGPDWPYTLEWKKFSVSIFPANYQCQSVAKIYLNDGTHFEQTETSRAAMHRCEPYREWFRLHERCRVGDLQKIAWTFASSINGGPFYQLVNVENACLLSYSAFGHNPWIRTPSGGAPIVGYPDKNAISKSSPRSKSPLMTAGPRIQRTQIELWLSDTLPTWLTLYWLLWWVALGLGLRWRLKSLQFAEINS